MDPNVTILLAVAELTKKTNLPDTATVFREAAKVNALLKDKTTISNVATYYASHQESFIVDGKPLATHVECFVKEYNEFPNIEKLSTELKVKPKKAVASAHGQAIMAADPKGFVVEELEEKVEAGCGNPNCDLDHSEHPMMLHSICHPTHGVAAHYFKGTVQLTCAGCGRFILNLKIASAEE